MEDGAVWFITRSPDLLWASLLISNFFVSYKLKGQAEVEGKSLFC